MRISDWSSYVCSSDLHRRAPFLRPARLRAESCRHETASEGLTMAGKFFDEWQIGDSIAHDIRRTVTETDNLLFTTMTHNPQPLHLDIEAAKASEFGQILVNGTLDRKSTRLNSSH